MAIKLKATMRMILFSFLLLSSSAWAFFPPGTEFIIKKKGLSWNKEKGMIVDSSGNPVAPSPETYSVVGPGQPGHSGTPAPKAGAATTSSSSDSGGSNYRPKGTSSITPSNTSQTAVNVDRMPISEETDIPAHLRVTPPKTELAGSSHTEINELHDIMDSSIKKTKELYSKLQKGEITKPVFTQTSDKEIKPKLLSFKARLQTRRTAVLQKSYYVHIIDEQIKLCDQLVQFLDKSARSSATLQSTDFKTMAQQLAHIEKSVSLIPLKYQTMDTQ